MTRGAQSGIPSTKPQNINEKERAERHFERLSNYKQTRITFNKGGSWQPLTPPLKNMDGKPYHCPKNVDCYLHLNSHSSSHFGSFYSTETAVGIIIGTGNGIHTEPYLSYSGAVLVRTQGLIRNVSITRRGVSMDLNSRGQSYIRYG